MLEKLYTKDVLRLTTMIPRLGRLDQPDGTARERSSQCGSIITVDVKVEDGRITDFAQDVQACALSQAAAALTARHLIGATQADLEAAYTGIEAMLKDNGPVPPAPWADFGILQPVREYPPRHASILLPLKAALGALEDVGREG